MIDKKVFGNYNGETVYNYQIKNGDVSVEILNYGAIIRCINFPDKNGKILDLVLGYDDVESYARCDCYFGAIIGRVANRIKGAKFTLNGKTYSLYDNDNGNSLHGGKSGFNDKVFNAEILDDYTLKLTYFSPDGEENYPANLAVSVTYSLSEGGELKIFYQAESDEDTVINLTNHTYFNLDGDNSGYALNSLLKIDADFVTPITKSLTPTGEKLLVNGTPFDFKEFKKIGKDIDKCDEQLIFGKGYDINFCLNGEGLRKVAVAKSEKSGITLETFTTEKGVQLYTANYVKNQVGKNGHVYNERDAFCLETQGYPNAVNQDKFPSQILKKGEKFSSTTIYKLSVN